MNEASELAQTAANSLRTAIGVQSYDAVVVLGSGWTGAAAAFGEVLGEVGVAELPGFHPPLAEGHAGLVRAYRVGSRSVLAFLGRTHLYEGHGAAAVAHPIRTAAALGLNEMCYTQWVALRDQLKAKPGYGGLTEQVVVTNYNIPNCYDPVVNPNGWYVMGLLSKYDSKQVMFGNTPYLDLGYHYRQRFRKLVCGDVSVPRAAVVRACVTHTEVPLPLVDETSFPDNPDIANDPNYGRSINYAQAKVIAKAITPMANRMPVALLGDLNELPFLPSLDFFYRECGGRGVFDEVDSRDPRWPVIRHFNVGTDRCAHRQAEWTMGAEGNPDIYDKPYQSNRRIDYIFVDHRHFKVGPDSGWVISTPFSDHRIAGGEVTLRHRPA